MPWFFQVTYIKALDYNLVLSALNLTIIIFCDQHKCVVAQV
jgi:hypothetical protein